MDITAYFHLLDNNMQDTLQLVKGCTETQLHFKKEEQWSIMEVLEHISKSDTIVSSFLLKPFDATAEHEELWGQKRLTRAIVDRIDQKVKAPESMQPKGELKDIAAFEKLFLQQRNLLKQNIQSGIIVIDKRVRKHPLLGEMTISDWLYFIPLHAQRHLQQIKNILAQK